MTGANPYDELHTTLVNLQRQKPKLSVIIRADKNFRYDYVIKVLDVVREAGITTLSLATQAE